MTALAQKHCTPCDGGTQPLSRDEAAQLRSELNSAWQISSDGKALKREYRFKNFYHTMSFANALAYVANSEDHHPDLELGYNYCRVLFTTHAIGGLSQNDFICAARVDVLEDRP